MSQSGHVRNGPPPPKTVAEVLCREVGAVHPDGALKQIRTMKRLLRSHYEAQQRLKRYDVDGAGDAVGRIADLNEEVRTLRAAQRRRAEASVAALDDALDFLADARDRLRERARSAPSATSTPPNPSSPNQSSADASADALAIVDAVEAELDELRLELWVQHDASVDEIDSLGANATSLLRDLTDRLNDLQSANTSLRRERSRLRLEQSALQRRVDQQQARIRELEKRTETP